jgi:hypothetical protein
MPSNRQREIVRLSFFAAIDGPGRGHFLRSLGRGDSKSLVPSFLYSTVKSHAIIQADSNAFALHLATARGAHQLAA